MIAVLAVTVVCSIGAGAKAQALDFRFTPQEAVGLAHRLGVHDPRSPAFKGAVCGHLQEALETVEGDVEDREELCETDDECEGLEGAKLADYAASKRPMVLRGAK